MFSEVALISNSEKSESGIYKGEMAPFQNLLILKIPPENEEGRARGDYATFNKNGYLMLNELQHDLEDIDILVVDVD